MISWLDNFSYCSAGFQMLDVWPVIKLAPEGALFSKLYNLALSQIFLPLHYLKW